MRRRELLRSLALLALAACTRTAASPSPAPTRSPSPLPSPSASATEPGTAPAATTSLSEPAASDTPTDLTSAPDATPTPTPTAEPTPEPAPTPTPTPAGTPAAVTVQEICRQSLGLPDARPDERTHTIAGLMLHHTAVASDRAAQAPGRLRGHANYHRDQGWPDIAYHVGVDLDGNVYELRNTATPGDTFTDYDPGGWFLLVAEGDFNSTTPTPAMLEAIAEVFAWAAMEFGVRVDTLAGHRDAASTSCPGDRLYGALGSIRDRAQQLVDARAVQRVMVCSAEGDARVAAIEAGE